MMVAGSDRSVGRTARSDDTRLRTPRAKCKWRPVPSTAQERPAATGPPQRIAAGTLRITKGRAPCPSTVRQMQIVGRCDRLHPDGHGHARWRDDRFHFGSKLRRLGGTRCLGDGGALQLLSTIGAELRVRFHLRSTCRTDSRCAHDTPRSQWSGKSALGLNGRKPRERK